MLGHACNDGVLCEMTNQTRLQTPPAQLLKRVLVITHLNSRELNFCFVALCENTENTEFRKCLKEFAAVHTLHACAVISSSRRQHKVYARVSTLSLTSLSFAGSGQVGAGSSSDSTMAGAYKVTMAR